MLKFGLGLLGKLMFGGGLRTAATVGGAGYAAHELTDGASTQAIRDNVIDPVIDVATGQIDQNIANFVYDYIFGPLGVSREQFDRTWEQLDPTALGMTVGAAVAADKTLDVMGLDIFSTKAVVFAATAFHMAKQFGLMDKVKDFLVEQGYAPDEVLQAFERENRDFNVAARGPEEDAPATTQSEGPQPENVVAPPEVAVTAPRP